MTLKTFLKKQHTNILLPEIALLLCKNVLFYTLLNGLSIHKTKKQHYNYTICQRYCVKVTNELMNHVFLGMYGIGLKCSRE